MEVEEARGSRAYGFLNIVLLIREYYMAYIFRLLKSCKLKLPDESWY